MPNGKLEPTASITMQFDSITTDSGDVFVCDRLSTWSAPLVPDLENNIFIEISSHDQ